MRLTRAGWAIVTMSAFCVQTAHGQIATAEPGIAAAPGVAVIPDVHWGWVNLHDPIASRIHAQADLIRASGYSARRFAEARLLHAQAVDKELDNWMKAVRNYWDRQIIREEKLVELERKKQYRLDLRLDRQKIMNSRTWDRLKNHPELTGASIIEGRALNFLLTRLSAIPNALEEAGGDALKLSNEQLHALQLRQLGRGGEQFVFRVDSELKLDRWPYLLRQKEFEALRLNYEKEREFVIAEAKAGATISPESLQRLEHRLRNLTRQFYLDTKPEQWAKQGIQKFMQYKLAEGFLRSRAGEVVRLQNGDAEALRAALGFDPKRHGDNLVNLLKYMITSGLDFAPAAPSDEPAYHAAFSMMRDLYVVVAERDEGADRPDRF